MLNDTTRLLGLDGLPSSRSSQEMNTLVKGRSSGWRRRTSRRGCAPSCGVMSTRMKEWVITRPRDLPVAGRRCERLWRKGRWICSTVVCPRKKFTEQVPARAWLIQRLRQASAGSWS
ncbi:hypothetical protein GCM10023334_106660 [Nonomuraea thailandensis]